MKTDPAALADRIQAWREDEMTGYDTAIELLCEAEPLLRAQAQTIAQQKAVLDKDYEDKDYEIDQLRAENEQQAQTIERLELEIQLLKDDRDYGIYR